MCNSAEEHDNLQDDFSFFSILPAFRNYAMQKPVNRIVYCANELPLWWCVLGLVPLLRKTDAFKHTAWKKIHQKNSLHVGKAQDWILLLSYCEHSLLFQDTEAGVGTWFIARDPRNFLKARKGATVICKSEHASRQAVSLLVTVRVGAPHDPLLLSGTGGPSGALA